MALVRATIGTTPEQPRNTQKQALHGALLFLTVPCVPIRLNPVPARLSGMGYRYSPRRHTRYTRYNERLKRWEWCLFSVNHGRCLEVLMHSKDLRALECMIEGWEKSEAESQSQTV